MTAVNASFQYPFQNSTATDAQWRGYFQAARTDGVVASSTLGVMGVAQDTGLNMNVVVAAGQFMIQGDLGEWATSSTLTCTTANGANPRIDTVVVRLTTATPVIQLDILAGTPAATPVAPTLTQSGVTWELPLANIAVGTGVTAITTANITDRRVWGSAGAPARAVTTAGATALVYGVGTLPNDVILPVSGTNLTITSITVGPAGSRLTLVFASYGNLVKNTGTLVLAADYGSTVNGTLELASDGTNWVEVTRTVALVAGATAPNNALTNGDLSVWQRGTSFVTPASLAYNADRWQWLAAIATATVTITQDGTIPTVAATAITTPYALKVAVTGADVTINAGDRYGVQSSIEGFDYRALTNGFAVSFWVRAHRTGTYCIAARNRGPDRSYVIEYTVIAADTWEYKTVVFPAPPTAGTWSYTNGIGLTINFSMAAGTTFQTAANAWQAGDFVGTSNQVNGVGAVTDIFSVALVNVVPGAVPYTLSPMPYQPAFARCQRYCQKIAAVAANSAYGPAYNNSTTTATATVPLRVSMLATPTATFTAANTFEMLIKASGLVALTAISLSTSSTTEVAVISTTVAAGLTAGEGSILIDVANASSILLESNPS